MRLLSYTLGTCSILYSLLASAAPTTPVPSQADLEGQPQLELRQSLSSTRNDITSKAACKAVTVIFARGT